MKLTWEVEEEVSHHNNHLCSCCVLVVNQVVAADGVSVVIRTNHYTHHACQRAVSVEVEEHLKERREAPQHHSMYLEGVEGQIFFSEEEEVDRMDQVEQVALTDVYTQHKRNNQC